MTPRRRPPRTLLLSALSVTLLGACSAAPAAGTAPQHRAGAAATTSLAPDPTAARSGTRLPSFTGSGAGHLLPGSDPSVLPGSILVADEGNDRLVVVDRFGRVAWTFPQPGDLPAGVRFQTPDDAFFTPDGKHIIATEEEYSVVTLIDIATRRIVWRHGTPGVPGSGPGRLSNPDDALVLPGGYVLTADIKNCRLLLFDPGAQSPRKVFGTAGRCRHRPPSAYGSPNGAFPMRNGHYLVTEIRGDWVDEIDLSGRVYASVHPPGVLYPSDTNEVRPGTYLTVDFSYPGKVETFDAAGRLLWRYAPRGSQALNHPSLALPLPNGDVLVTDDHNDRIIVLDPHTNRIVWQYGLRGRAGSGPGFLNGPDGLDLVPPWSDLVSHASTMGRPKA